MVSNKRSGSTSRASSRVQRADSSFARRFRSFKSERQKAPPAGFVDGNFVERFAELGPEDVERVMRGRGEFEGLIATKEQVLRVVEEMARMH